MTNSYVWFTNNSFFGHDSFLFGAVACLLNTCRNPNSKVCEKSGRILVSVINFGVLILTHKRLHSRWWTSSANNNLQYLLLVLQHKGDCGIIYYLYFYHTSTCVLGCILLNLRYKRYADRYLFVSESNYINCWYGTHLLNTINWISYWINFSRNTHLINSARIMIVMFSWKKKKSQQSKVILLATTKCAMLASDDISLSEILGCQTHT